MRGLLEKNVVKTVFIKKNGDTRVMYCTLMPNLLPEIKGEPRKLPVNLITVFDIEIQEWRTLNMDTIINYEVVDV